MMMMMITLLSGKRKNSYKKVTKAEKQIMSDAAVSKMVIDLEADMWRAIARVYSLVKIMGCCFHWCQCVWSECGSEMSVNRLYIRRIQEFGLVTAYRSNHGTMKLYKQLMALSMALSYLPSEHIPAVFDALCVKATTDSLNSLVEFNNDLYNSYRIRRSIILNM